MIADVDPAIKEAAALVLELNEDDRERLLAHDRWKWEMDQAALRRQSYRNGKAKGVSEGKKAAKAQYKQELEKKDRQNQAIRQELEALRRRLREAGIDPP
jgi:flagellar biosynthesis/type III secretory pathway protein FliH